MTDTERQWWERATDAMLIHEYLDMQRTALGLFALNARRHQDDIAGLLLALGITEIPNIFGAIPVRLWHSRDGAEREGL